MTRSDEEEKRRILNLYAKSPTLAIRNRLIELYAPLVKIIAGKLSLSLGSLMEMEDLCSFGVFGLIDAIDKFDFSKDVKFETYATLRIRGSMLDAVRQQDSVSRSVRQKKRQLDEAKAAIEERTGQPATDEQIADELDISLDKYYKVLSQTHIVKAVSLEDYTQEHDIANPAFVSSDFVDPSASYEREELKVKLKDAMSALTPKEQKVILLRYYEDCTHAEIAEVLSVSESRVSQLHAKAIVKMGKYMGDYIGVLAG